MKNVFIALLSILLTACEDSPEAKELRVAERAVNICQERLERENDVGVRAIMANSCKQLEAEYQDLKHK